MRVMRKPPKNNVRNVESHGRNLRGASQNKAHETAQFEFFRDSKLQVMMSKDRTIRDFISQPEIIWYQDINGKMRDYVPDYKVFRTDGSIEFHQTVRLINSDRPDIRHRNRAIEAICAQRGCRYVVHIEEQMVGPTEFANLNALSTFRARCHANPNVETHVRALLAGGKRIPLGDLTDMIAEDLGIAYQFATAALGHMLWNETLMVDLRARMLFVFARPAAGVLVWLPNPSAPDEGTRVPP
jgi:hypothetical protein